MRQWHLAALLIIGLVACAGPSAPAPTAAPTVASVPATPIAAAPTPAPSATRPAPTAVPSATPAPTAVPTVAPSATPALPRYDLVLRGGTLIDGGGGPPLPDAAIAIRDGLIVAVGPASALSFAPDTPVRELPGTTFLPGFVNAHAHTRDLNDEQLRGWVRAGVTTLRDLGGPRDLLLAKRAALEAAADPTLPRLLVTGPIVTVPGGHPIPLQSVDERDRALAVRGPEDAAAQIGGLLDSGVNLIKIAVSGRSDTAWPELSDAEIRAIADTAHARGARVAAHVDRAVALRRAVLSGIDDAAHMPRDRMPDELIAEMVARGVALVPTIDVYEGLAEERGIGPEWRRSTLLLMRDNLRRFAAAGGTLALGDDYGNPRVEIGMPMPEIRHWLAAGLSPMQVIVAATHGSALVSGLAGEVGMLQAGMAADILVVEGDPLADIGALERPRLVLRSGQIAFGG
jgi:imidazolonepropionase-like amidohydrolase